MIKTASKIISAFLTGLIFFTPIRAEAVDAWMAAAQSLGVLAIYNSTLKSMLALGNDVNAQMAARQQDIKKNGADKNPADIQLVDEIMTRLVNSANYELKVNSLPFVWNVNDSEKFNAACYPMNYISVNRGLLSGLNMEEEQIAFVLAHEMIHGLNQHSAKSYAQAAAQSLGAMFIGMNVDSSNIDWSKFSGIVNYSVAKSIILPAEVEADESGFYIATSAGFNPGAGAAAMARMDYYFRYETQDIFEVDLHDKPNEQTFSDHPDTEVREEKLSQLMTDYSMGHVTVKKVERQYKVYIDGKAIYTASYARAADKAYYFAGGLAKAFHDYDNVDAWNFRKGAGNHTDFLTDDKVFQQVRDIAFLENIGDKIRSAVAAAYKNEKPAIRKKYFDAENKRLDALKKIKAENLNADTKAAEKLRINADAYNDHKEGKLALIEIERAMQAKNQDNLAECLAIRGRAKAICGDFDGALADVNQAVAQDNKNLYNFLNRADVRRMRGEYDLAFADIDRALKIDSKVAVIYQLRGGIYDELGDETKAEENFRTCYELAKKNPRSIPLKYLKRIDAKAAEKLGDSDFSTNP